MEAWGRSDSGQGGWIRRPRHFRGRAREQAVEPQGDGRSPEKGPLPRDQDDILKKAFLEARSDKRSDRAAESYDPSQSGSARSRREPVAGRGVARSDPSGQKRRRERRGDRQGHVGGPGPALGHDGSDDALPSRGQPTFCDGLMDSFNRWRDDLGVLHLDPELTVAVVSGVVAKAKGDPTANLSEHRDALLVAVQQATAPLPKGLGRGGDLGPERRNGSGRDARDFVPTSWGGWLPSSRRPAGTRALTCPSSGAAHGTDRRHPRRNGRRRRRSTDQKNAAAGQTPVARPWKKFYP